jgi:hypothetical protein
VVPSGDLGGSRAVIGTQPVVTLHVQNVRLRHLEVADEWVLTLVAPEGENFNSLGNLGSGRSYVVLHEGKALPLGFSGIADFFVPGIADEADALELARSLTTEVAVEPAN